MMANYKSSDAAAPVDLSHHYSHTLNNRHPSTVKNFYKYFGIPGIGNLAGGNLPIVYACPS